jgi:outer membrane immunogenic protein
MKKLLLASLALAALAAVGPAIAADMPFKARVYKAPPPVWSWTGFYIGGNVGYSWGRSRTVAMSCGDVLTCATGAAGANVPPGHTLVDPATMSFDNSGWVGGLQVGYNWQFSPKWLAGFEADFDFANIRGSGATIMPWNDVPPSGESFTAAASDKIKSFGTVRGRFGYLPADNLLIFATGGFAYGRVEQAATGINNGPFGNAGFGGSGFSCPGPFPSLCFSNSRSRTLTGWTAGAGVEYMIWNGVTLKAEYLHVDLGGSTTLNLPSTSNAPGNNPSSLNARFNNTTFNIVRTGLNWHF